MKIIGENGYIAFYNTDEEGVGKLLDGSRLVFFKPSETIYHYTIDDLSVGFVHEENILGYLE